jgi:hypothetical protein
MTQQHPFTPPPELIEQWYDAIDDESTSWKQQLAARAAQWGYEQHEKMLLDAMHAVVPQPYEPEAQ